MTEYNLGLGSKIGHALRRRRARMVVLSFTLVAAVISQPASAQEKPVGAPIGNWRVMAETNSMTDKNDCVAYYGPSKSIQLTATSLGISYRGRGGLKGYTIRFDSDPPLETALPTRTEERIGAMIINSDDTRWQRLKTAKRIRVQTLTLLPTIIDDDIDLTALPSVMARLTGPSCT